MMKARLIAILLIGLSLTHSPAHAASQKLCANSGGAVASRSKCKKGETVVTLASIGAQAASSLSALVGPVGPAGAAGPTGTTGPTGPRGATGLTSITRGPRGVLDFSACHRIVSGPATSSGSVSLAANCDPYYEFLFEDEWTISGGRALIQAITHNTATGSNNEPQAYGVEISASLISGSDFFLTVKALCCPR